MGDIRKSILVKQGSYASDYQKTGFRKGFGCGNVAGRTFSIGDFLNNYNIYVDQMAAIDPLPVLSPLKPYPDPFVVSKKEHQEVRSNVETWPCGYRKTQQITKDRFPRTRDWMHDWSEFMYKIGEFGAKTMK